MWVVQVLITVLFLLTGNFLGAYSHGDNDRTEHKSSAHLVDEVGTEGITLEDGVSSASHFAGEEHDKTTFADSFGSIEDTRDSGLLTWLEHNGVDVHKAKIQLAHHFGENENERGIKASTPIKAGEEIFHLPTKVLISKATLRRSAIGGQISDIEAVYSPDQAERCFKSMTAAFLLYEREAGPSSFWSAFIDALPDTFDTPVFWYDADLSKLQRSPLRLSTYRRRKEWHKDYEKLAKIFSDFTRFQLNDFFWAATAVDTRVFNVEGKYLLLPFVDSFSRQCDASYRLTLVKRNGVVIQAERDYDRGEQVFVYPENCCSSHCLLERYGEILSDNKLDHYELKLLVDREHMNYQNFWEHFCQPCLEDSLLKQKLQFAAKHNLVQPIKLAPGEDDKLLLLTARLLMTTPKEFAKFKSEILSGMVSEGSERRAYRGILAFTGFMLHTYGTTIEADEKLMLTRSESYTTSGRNAITMRLIEKRILNYYVNHMKQLAAKNVPNGLSEKVITKDLNWSFQNAYI